MSRKVADINKKIAYITNRQSGPILKTKRPLYLRDAVATSQSRRYANYCQDEAASLFTCLAEHDYNNAMCGDELRAMLLCEKNVLKSQSASENRTGSSDSDDVDVRTKNKLLQQHPTLTSKRALRVQRNNYITLPAKRAVPVPFKETHGRR